VFSLPGRFTGKLLLAWAGDQGSYPTRATLPERAAHHGRSGAPHVGHVRPRGAGVLAVLRDYLVLTAPGRTSRRWALPLALHPDRAGAHLSHHRDPAAWTQTAPAPT